METFCYVLILVCLLVSVFFQFCEIEDYQTQLKKWEFRCKNLDPDDHEQFRNSLLLKEVAMLVTVLATIVYIALCIVPRA